MKRDTLAILEAALKNAVRPEYDFYAKCSHCGKESLTDNGEWLIWCGEEEHAKAILQAAKKYLKLWKLLRG